MANKGIVEEVNARIKAMQEKKAAELETIHQKQAEAQTQKEAAELAIREAMDRMDVAAYEEAKQASDKAQTAITMYRDKYTQISKQEYISEAESDETIDALLAHEKDLADDFKKDLAGLLKQLHELQVNYAAAVIDTENTIKSWTSNIHANYRSSSTTYRETGTNRSPKPIPVRMGRYEGCSESIRLATFLKANAGLYDA